MKSKLLLFILLIFTVSYLFSQEMHTFTDINSKTLDAEYLYMFDGIVRFRTVNNTIVKADFDNLTPESQRLVLRLKNPEKAKSFENTKIIQKHSLTVKNSHVTTPTSQTLVEENTIETHENVLETPIYHKKTHTNHIAENDDDIPYYHRNTDASTGTYSNRALPLLDQTRPVHVCSYTRVQNGKIVHVRSYTRNYPGMKH